MNINKKLLLSLCLFLSICITGCNAKQTYEILSTKDEKAEDISLMNWSIKNDTLYHEKLGYQIVDVYQFNDHGDLIVSDTKELIDLYTTSFVEHTDYQDIHDETYIKKNAIRTIIQLSDDSQAPCELNVEGPVTLKTTIVTSYDKVADDVINALYDHKENVKEERLDISHKFHIDENKYGSIYGVYFIPIYESMSLKDEAAEYQILQPVMNDDKRIEGYFVVIEKPYN